MKPGKQGIERIIDAAGYSFKGFKACYKHEAAFRQEILLFIVLTPFALWIGDTGVEYALLFGSLFIVLITELLNSAVEATVDRFGGEIHKLSGRAKDIGSAAVFVSLVNLAVTWLFILVI